MDGSKIACKGSAAPLGIRYVNCQHLAASVPAARYPGGEGGKASLRIALSLETPLEMEFTIPPINASDNDVHYLCEGWVRNEVGMLQISILAVWLQAV